MPAWFRASRAWQRPRKGAALRPCKPGSAAPQGAIAEPAKGWYERPMEELFGHYGYKGFVLQDLKRLPSRFFARLSGALLARRA